MKLDSFIFIVYDKFFKKKPQTDEFFKEDKFVTLQ